MGKWDKIMNNDMMDIPSATYAMTLVWYGMWKHGTTNSYPGLFCGLAAGYLLVKGTSWVTVNRDRYGIMVGSTVIVAAGSLGYIVKTRRVKSFEGLIFGMSLLTLARWAPKIKRDCFEKPKQIAEIEAPAKSKSE